MDRRQSKMTLFDLFSKPKVERARAIHEPVLEPLSERSETPVHFYRHQETPRQPEPTTMYRPSSRSSSRTPSLRSGPSKVDRTPAEWNPPPLFQAYPQAIKHGALDGTNLSAETVLQASNRYQETIAVPGAIMLLREDKVTQQSEAARYDQKRFSAAIDFLDISEKIFVLTTTCRILQYSGKGNHDRLPERSLQLCNSSAAFACDLIPGKHWVLQIVQSTGKDSTPVVKQNRSILSRLKVATTSSRKNVTSMLMIFNSPENMDGWLKVLRKSIEQMGGKKIEPDPDPRPEKRHDEANPPANMPSHRYQVQRDPRQPQPLKPENRPVSSKSGRSANFQLPMELPPPLQFQPSLELTTFSPSTDSPQMATVDRSTRASRVSHATSIEVSSVATSTLSSDQIRLDQQHDSSRQSLISTRTSRTSETEAVTMPTSRGSSSPTSPQKESFTEPDTQRSPAGLKSFALSTIPGQKSRRTSTQAQPMPRISPQWTQKEIVIPPGYQRIEEVPSPNPTVSESPASYVQDPQPKPVEDVSLRISTTESLERPGSFAVESEDGNTSTRPTSTIGQLPNLSQRSLNRFEQRTEPPRKLFMKPIPVKPSEPHSTPPRRASGNPETLRSNNFTPGQARTTDTIVSRQHVSFPATPGVTASFQSREKIGFGPTPVRTSFSRPLTLRNSHGPPANTNTTILTTESSPTFGTKSSPTQPSPTTAKALRRPTSMQIRSDPAPFLSSRQPQSRSRVSVRSSSASPIPLTLLASPTATQPSLHSSLFVASLVPSHPDSVAPPPIPPMNPNRPAVRSRTSIATVIAPGMPPPAHPPPNIPLPKLPTSQPVS